MIFLLVHQIKPQNFRLTGLGKGTMSKYFQKYELILYSSSKLETGSQIIELDKYMKTRILS